MAFRLRSLSAPFIYLWQHRTSIATWTARLLPALALTAGFVALHLFVQASLDPAEFSISNDHLNRTGLIRLPPGRTSLLDDNALAQLGAQIERSPQIKRIVRLERVFPNNLRIQIERRQPYLSVRVADRYYAVDEEAVRLEGEHTTEPATQTRIVISGIMSKVPAPGQPWRSRDMMVGFEMVDTVLKHGTLKAVVEEVDVTNIDGRVSRLDSEIVLYCRGQWKLYWGGPPSSKRLGEISTEEKLRNLMLVLRNIGQIEELEYAIVYVKDRPTIRKKSGQAAYRESR